jgi:integrase
MESTRGIYEKQKGSGVWFIYWTDKDGGRHREKAGRLSDAKRLLDKRKTEVLQGKKLPEMFPGKVNTFGDLAKDALNHSKEENGARHAHELGLKFAIIGEEFDDRDAAKITKQHITGWLLEQTVEREWSPATRNRYQAAFSLVFRLGTENGKVESNPASQIKRKKESEGRVRFLQDEEREEQRIVDSILERFPDYLPCFLISIHTGLRRSRQLSLQWPQINMNAKAKDGSTRALITFPGGAGKKAPSMMVNEVATEQFRILHARAKAKGGSVSGPVFLNMDGSPMKTTRDWFEVVVVNAGLQTDDENNYTWHCNRHTFASRLVMAGVNLRTVMELMGHSSLAMTMRYAHLAPGQAQEAVEMLVNRHQQKPTATGTATDQKSGKRQGKKNGIKLVKSVA